ncbi:patatin-like phospholipase family protein [Vermiculatibacterium agrestimuris]|uniref:patatin-like phospholipase family protein n=1 Tax=Vermiculatibacterium agrestimuris TaxID=2941519 RepID=UPI00203C3198|nr:patatin family protein [Vermiculatibacterium agrestimuris]
MLGIIDVGGGMRGSFTAGIYDYLNDQGVQPFDYLIGVSAGSGNMVSYLAGQRGRNLRFYLDYAFRKEYMSMHNMLRKGSYINLDYPYTILSGPGGEDPVDLEAFNASAARYEAVVTDAATGDPVYYDKALLREGNFDPIKASCAVPGACQPYPVMGRPGFDGGVADPVPYKRAIAQGCDRIVLLLTRPADYLRPPLDHQEVMEKALRRWPNAYGALLRRSVRYNTDVAAVKALEQAGKALLIAPSDIAGMATLTKDRAVVERLYHMGYAEGAKVLEFARSGKSS